MENCNHRGNPKLIKEWDLVTQIPLEEHLVDSKLMFTIKHNVDGSINKFKGLLVTKCFTQSNGVDY